MPDPHKTASRFVVPEPYPEIRVSGPNLFYAQLLHDDFASNASELNAIHQYLYHHYRFDRLKLKELAELEEGISLVEMHHLEILAELIQLLGGDPRYRGFRNNNGQYYDASYVYYGFAVQDMLSADIASEAGAINQYQEHVRQIHDPYVQAVLNRIIKDEQLHLQMFTNALQRYRNHRQD